MDSSAARPHRPSLQRDLVAGLVVFLVALPLCLGIALASGKGVSPMAGLLAGIVGGLIIGPLSGSHTSVSGPAAGLTAVVAAQITLLGSFEAFLVAVSLAGLLQLGLAWLRAGSLAAFFPTSVIKGLLAAIGLLLILKQIPHLFGRDTDPDGEMSFRQPDKETTFSELLKTFEDPHIGPAVVGVLSIALLIFWQRTRVLKNCGIPAPLIIVALGVVGTLLLEPVGGDWTISGSHLVQVPIADGLGGFVAGFQQPDFSALSNSAVYTAAVTIAIVASLETLLNLEAVDGLDPYKRVSNPNRELMAQGVGNLTCGFIGALPVTSVIVRSSVNIGAGATTRRSAIFHGIILLGFVVALPQVLNLIPKSALAAILIVTGFKLASPQLFKSMLSKGFKQFLPFVVTIVAIIGTDLLVGIIIGLVVAISFILHSNTKSPMRRFREKHVGGDVTRIELGNQVTFLNRASLQTALNEIPQGTQCLLDASDTDYIDPDVLDLILDFEANVAPTRGVTVNLRGFKAHYEDVEDRVHFHDFTDEEAQRALTPEQVLELLSEGNKRFVSGQRVHRDLVAQVRATAHAPYPMAVVLSSIDSRTPNELIFDMGLGDVFSVRTAGHVVRNKVLGSLEYSCVVAGAKLIVVLGHTSCGVVSTAVDLLRDERRPSDVTGCDNLDVLIGDVQKSVDPDRARAVAAESDAEQTRYKNEVAWANVLRTVQVIHDESPVLDRMVAEGKIGIVGAMYDVQTGEVQFTHREIVAEATT